MSERVEDRSRTTDKVAPPRAAVGQSVNTCFLYTCMYGLRSEESSSGSELSLLKRRHILELKHCSGAYKAAKRRSAYKSSNI